MMVSCNTIIKSKCFTHKLLEIQSLLLAISLLLTGCKQDEANLVNTSLAFTGNWRFSVKEGIDYNINTAPDTFTYDGAIMPAIGENRITIFYGVNRQVSLFIHFHNELREDERFESYSRWSGRFIALDTLELRYENVEIGPEHQIRINATRI